MTSTEPKSVYDTVYAQLKEEQEIRSKIVSRFKILLFIFLIGMAGGITLIALSDTLSGLKYSLIVTFGFIAIVITMIVKYGIDIYTSMTREHIHMNRIATIKNSYLESIQNRKGSNIFEFELDGNKSNKENQEEMNRRFVEFVENKVK